ncbi:MAG: hypothetical protein V4515_12440 [Chloroflexota bacterium]
MRKLRLLADAAGRLVSRILGPIRPEPGTTEGAVLFGLTLIAAGFLAAQMLGSIAFAPLALLVPGAILVLLGALPAFRTP